MPKLSRVLLDRLPRYYRFVRELIARQGDGAVSSSQIADFIGADDTQVRKDLAAIGVRGIPRVGFHALTIQHTIHAALGYDRVYNTVIVGAGRLGGAIASYPGFTHYGMNLVGVFDMQKEKIGSRFGDLDVLSTVDLESSVRALDVQLAIITIPAEEAQQVANRLVAGGVQAIWNFSPSSLQVPDYVTVRDEHLSVGLAELSYALKRRKLSNPPAAESAISKSDKKPKS